MKFSTNKWPQWEILNVSMDLELKPFLSYLLKIGMPILAPKPCQIFNLLLSKGIYPDPWKIACKIACVANLKGRLHR